MNPDRRGGFALIEMMISIFLFLVLLLIAADLLLESSRILHHSSRRATNPMPEFAAETLRQDLRGATGVHGSTGLWSPDPLRLGLASGETIVWSVDDFQRLVRSERPYLAAVDSWRWRQLSPRLVEVEVRFSAPGGETYLRHAASPRPRNARPTSEVIRLVVALRGAGGSGW
ncbi:MAG: prepilin-type N-terminal cleavage/methylation domain-containing protein [Thermoanaerobaculia bacterium]|nr:prepilin-type N-terminal cleavage/methylation domain-containing protein [Thermoanaerobaculia bacterium]